MYLIDTVGAQKPEYTSNDTGCSDVWPHTEDGYY